MPSGWPVDRTAPVLVFVDVGFVCDVADETTNVYLFVTGAAFDVVASVTDVFHQQFVGVGFWCGVAFALGAVAGDEFFVG